MMTWGFLGLLAILPALFTLGCLVGLAVLLVRALRHRKMIGATCGKCAYPAQGLTQLRCPECGSSLLEAGIDTDRQRGVMSPGRFATLWSLLLPGPVIVLAVLAIALGPMHEHRRLSVNLQPKSGAYSVGIVEYNAMGPLWTGPGADGVVITVTSMQQTASQGWGYYQADLDTLTFSDATTGGGQPQPINEQAVAGWLTHAGANPADPATADEAREIVQLLIAASTSPDALTQSTVLTAQDNSYTDSQPALWWGLLVLLACLLAWVLPPILYLRLHRRRRDRWASAITAAPEPTVPTGGVEAVRTA
jgi:hypothetical protein